MTTRSKPPVVRHDCGHTQVEYGLGDLVEGDYSQCRKCGTARLIAKIIFRTSRERDNVVASCNLCDGTIRYNKKWDAWSQICPEVAEPLVCPNSYRKRHDP